MAFDMRAADFGAPLHELYAASLEMSSWADESKTYPVWRRSLCGTACTVRGHSFSLCTGHFVIAGM